MKRFFLFLVVIFFQPANGDIRKLLEYIAPSDSGAMEEALEHIEKHSVHKHQPTSEVSEDAFLFVYTPEMKLHDMKKRLLFLSFLFFLVIIIRYIRRINPLNQVGRKGK